MKRIAIVGAGGRMGLEVLQCVAAHPGSIPSALVLVADDPRVGKAPPITDCPLFSSSLHAALEQADIAIDFSLPKAFDGVVAAALAQKTPLVSGTTGLTDAQLAGLDVAAKTIAVLHSPNMSVGVQVMLSLLNEAVRLLGPSYDIEVVEAHHRYKRDAPSGTAKRLVQQLEEALVVRDGGTPQVPAHALRGGDVVGDHAVYFMGDGDRIEITHRATSRATFAQGALRAALWLVDQAPGRYTLADVLGS